MTRRATQAEIFDHNQDHRKNYEPHPLDTMRQPKMVTISVEGDKEDQQKWFEKLLPFLTRNSANVDFDIDPTHLTFRVYPFAIND